jgi:FAD/FMN-containing dehydrogenase
MQPYLTSWRNSWVGKSPLIALPSTTAQVAEIVGICHRNHIPIVPQGGNTGLVGGSVPTQGNEIVLNLSRLKRIRELDRVGSTVTVEAGVVLQSLQEAAADGGFLFPISMASQGSAEIGGAIATNAGGTAVLRYGNMRDLVMGLEVVLPDGQILSGLRKLPKDNTGYNLSSYFVGAEGTLGVITAATLKLFPALKQTLTSIVAIPDMETAMELLRIFRHATVECLSAFEIMSHQALELVRMTRLIICSSNLARHRMLFPCALFLKVWPAMLWKAEKFWMP